MAGKFDNSKRKWFSPKKRAEGYVEEKRAKVHKRGAKKNKELDAYNQGLRSGYLLCQSDHAGAYKYNLAKNAGLSKEACKEYSQTKGKVDLQEFAKNYNKKNK